MLKHRSRYALLVMVLAMLVHAGCGGGGGSGGGSTLGGGGGGGGVLSGFISDAAVSGATVQAFALNPDGTWGATPIATTTSGADGGYTLNLPAGTTGPLRIQATGGTFTDIAGGGSETLPATDPLICDLASAPANGANSSVHLTPLTTMAMYLSDAYKSRPGGGIPGASPADATETMQNAIRAAQTQVSGYFSTTGAISGLDIVSTPPTNLGTAGSGAGASANSQAYGTLLAGLSECARRKGAPRRGGTAPPMAALVRALAADLADDGVANGSGNGGQSVSLSDRTLTHALATDIQNVLGAAGNVSGLTAASPGVAASLTQLETGDNQMPSPLRFEGPNPLPLCEPGVSFSVNLSPSGGASPYTVTTSSTLPSGLTLSSAGVLSGTTSQVGSFTIAARVADARGTVVTQDFSLTVGTVAGKPEVRGKRLYAPADSNLLIATSQVPIAEVNVRYEAHIDAVGGTAPYTFALKDGSSLPADLTLTAAGASAGYITGVPVGSNVSPQYFTVTVTDSATPANTAEKTIEWVVTKQAQVKVQSTLPNATEGLAYSSILEAAGGVGPYTWALQDGSGLPSGLTLAASGSISGTPATGTGGQTYSFTVVLTDSADDDDADAAGVSVAETFSLVVGTYEPIVLNGSATLTPALETDTYVSPEAYTVSGGTAPYTFTAAGLPDWLAVQATDNSSCVFAGTIPEGADALEPEGGYAFQLTVVDSSSPALSATLGINLAVGPAPVITTVPTLPRAVEGRSYGADLHVSTGDYFPYRVIVGYNYIRSGFSSYSTPIYEWRNNYISWYWRVSAGALPNGLYLSPQGVISGTPAAGTAGSYTFTISSSAPSGAADAQTFTLTVEAPAVVAIMRPARLPGGIVGVAYSQTLFAQSGTTPYTWSIIDGALPVGLSLNAGTGEISGAPTTAGDASANIRVTDSTPGTPTTNSRVFAITIGPALSLTNATATYTLSSARVGSPASYSLPSILGVTGGTGAYAWSLDSGTLPAGVTLGTGGVLSGTPSAAATYSFTVAVADGAASVTQPCSLTVNPAIVALEILNQPILPNGKKGQPYGMPFAGRGGTPPYAWSLASGSLPTGLSLSAAGMVSGTISPSATAGLHTFVVRMNDSAASTPAELTCTLTVEAPPPSVVTGTLPGGMVGSAYSARLQAMGGTAPYAWAIMSGALPRGLALDSSTGVISGTPAVAGTFQADIAVVDTAVPPLTGTATISIQIFAPPLVLSVPATMPEAMLGTSYSFQLLASGGTQPYTWGAAAGSLPPGVSLDAATGQVSGTPTAAGVYGFGVGVRDSNTPPTSAFQVTSVTVTSPNGALAVAPMTLPSGQVGKSYFTGLPAVGGLPPYTWAVSSGSLPAGLSLATTGVISGTPTAAGTAVFNVTVGDSQSPQATAPGAFSITISVPPVVTNIPAVLPGGRVGIYYNAVLAATGGTSPYAWTIASGSLPAGLSLSAGGAITGTPTAAGVSSVTLRVTDSGALTVTSATSITIAAAPITVMTTSLPQATAGMAYSFALAAQGGTAPLSWSQAAGSALPPGLSLSTAGVLSGTPTSFGGFYFGVTARDASNPPQMVSAPLFLAIAPPAFGVGTATLTNGTVGVAYNQTLTPNGGTPTYTWAIIGGALPAGLNLNASSGAITGTPTAPGYYSFSVRVTDSSSPTALTADGLVSLSINPGATLTINSQAPGGKVGVAYSARLTVGGGTAPYRWSLSAGSPIPSGLSLSSDGVVSGTPTRAGWYSFSVSVTDSSATPLTASAPVPVSIAPADPLVVMSASLPPAKQNTAYSFSIAASGGVRPYAFTLDGGTLPAGITLGTDGTLSGTPTATGTSDFRVKVADAQSPPFEVIRQVSLAVNGAASLALTTTSLPEATVALSYNFTLGAAGGTAPYVWTGSNLPPGLGITPGGIVSGIPTVSGNFTFGVTVTDSTSPTASAVTASLTMSIRGGTPLTIMTTSLPTGRAGSVNYYDAPIYANGGNKPYSWSLLNGSALPGGLVLDPWAAADAWHIDGGSPNTAGTYGFTLQVRDSSSPPQTLSREFTITFTAAAPLTISTTSLAAGTAGTAYNTTLSATGGTPAYAWSVAVNSPPLPAGLVLAAGTGVLSGTPTQPGMYNFSIKVADAATATSVRSFSLGISGGALAINTPATLASASEDEMYGLQLNASGGIPPRSWGLISGTLPPGISLYPDGFLSGIPTTAATYTFTVGVADSSATPLRATKEFTLEVVGGSPLTVMTASLPEGTVDEPYSASLAANGGTPPYSWGLGEGEALPAGLDLSASGFISGTPTTAGDASFNATVFDNAGQSATTRVSVNILAQPLEIVTPVVPRATIGQPYSFTMESYGGTPAYVWSVDGTTPLPDGLALTAGSGLISGTPTTAGDYDVIIHLTDAAGIDVSRMYMMSVGATAYEIVLKSDGATQAGSLGSGAPSTELLARLDTADTTGVSWQSALVGAFGTYTPVPSEAPAGTEVINIPTGDGRNGYFKLTFTLPANFSNARLGGRVNMDDYGRVFLNGNAISPAIASGDPNKVTQFGDALVLYPGEAVLVPYLSTGYSYKQVTFGELMGFEDPAFDASSWSTGQGGFGTPSGGGVLNTPEYVKTNWTVNTDMLLRTNFTVPNGTPGLIVKVAIDNDIQVFINGTDISGGMVMHEGYPERDSFVFQVPGYMLNQGGSNLLAARARDRGGIAYADLSVVGVGADAGGYFQAGTNEILVSDANNGSGPSGGAFWFKVKFEGGAMAITTPPLATARVGDSYSTVNFAAQGGTSPYTWSLGMGGLPPGMTFSAAGVLSGTPTAAGLYDFEVVVSDSADQTALQSYFLRVDQVTTPPSFVTGFTPGATVGADYMIVFEGTGGVYPYSFAVAPGSTLPSGLSLSPDGTLSGVPSTAGQFEFTVQLFDSSSPPMSTNRAFGIQVSEPYAELSVGTTTLPYGREGVAYNGHLGAAGGTPPYTWTILSALPSGLSLTSSGADAGRVDGTPTAAGTYSVDVQVDDSAAGSAQATVSVTISPPDVPLAVSTAPVLPSGTTGVAYSQQLVAAGGTPPYSWSLSGTGFPPGLTLTNIGAISGTPSAAGAYNFTVTVRDTSSPMKTSNKTLSMQVNGVAISITTASLPAATSGSPYTTAPAVTGGTAPYTWSLAPASVALPAGLSLTASNGTISGTPSATGSFALVLRVTDTNGNFADKALSLNVTGGGTPPSIATASLPAGQINVAYNTTLTATGGVPSYTFSLDASSPPIPAGLSLSTGGVLSGTPTVQGNFSLTFRVTDSGGVFATRMLSINIVGNVVVQTNSLPAATQGSAYSFQLVAGGGTAPYTWSLNGGSGPLPAGVSLSSAGALSGTPSENGSFPITVRATDSGALFATRALTLMVNAAGGPPTISSFSPSSGQAGTQVTISGTGFTGTTGVTFNNVAATTFQVVSDTSIQASVPASATSGLVRVTTPQGTGASVSSFNVVTPPTIASFNPTSGAVGASVTITGTNFTAASSVRFNGVAAAYTVTNATTISVTVPEGASSGPISVTTPAGTANSSTVFTVTGVANTPLVVTLKDEMTRTPVAGKRVILHNLDGSVAEELTTDVNGVADFGDVGANRATITVIEQEGSPYSEWFLFTLHNTRTGDLVVPVWQEEETAPPIFTLVLTGVPAGTTDVRTNLNFWLNTPDVNGTTWTYHDVVAESHSQDIEEFLRPDGTFDLIVMATGGASNKHVISNRTWASLGGSTVTLALSETPSTVPFTAATAIKEIRMTAYRSGAQSRVGEWYGNPTTSGSLSAVSFGTLSAPGFYAQEARRRSTSGASQMEAKKLTTAFPASVTVTMPAFDLTRPVVTNSGGRLTGVSWSVTGSKTGIDDGSVELSGFLTATGQPVGWDIILDGQATSVGIPQLPVDLGGVAEFSNDGPGGKLFFGAWDQSGVSGYDDMITQVLTKFNTDPNFRVNTHNYDFGDRTLGAETRLITYRLNFMHFAAGGDFGAGTTPVMPGTVILDSYKTDFFVENDVDYPSASAVTFTGPGGSGLSATPAFARDIYYEDGEHVRFESPGVSSPAAAPGGAWSVNYKGVPQQFNKANPDAAARLVVPLPTVTVANDVLQSVSWEYRQPDGTPLASAPAHVTDVMVQLEGAGGRIYDSEMLSPDTTSHTLVRTVYWSGVSQMHMAYNDTMGNHYVVTFESSGGAGFLGISTSTLPSATQATSYNATLVASGGTSPYTWSIVGGALPSGLSLNSGSGQISGTPTGGGVSNFTVRVTDNASAVADRQMSINVIFSGTLASPGGVRAVPGSGRATVAWYPVENSTGYNVYMATVPGVTKTNYGSLAGGVRYVSVSNPFVVTGLANGTTYYCVATAVNAGGEGPISSEVVFTPGALQGGVFPVAENSWRETCFGMATNGTNILMGIQGTSASPQGIAVQMVTQSGLGAFTSLNELGGMPRAAFDGTNYLVVWEEDADPSTKVYGQLMSAAAAKVGSRITVATGTIEDLSGIAFDGTNYLVVWTTLGSPQHVYGQRVSAAGALVGSAFRIDGASGGRFASMSYGGGKYLVVYTDSATGTEIRGQFVATNGTMDGSEFVVNASPGLSDMGVTGLAYGGSNSLVVWCEEAYGQWDLYGQVVSPAGAPVGGVITVAAEAGDQMAPMIAFDGTNYLVTWADTSDPYDWDSYGRFVGANGALIGNKLVVTQDVGNQLGSQFLFIGGAYRGGWNTMDGFDGLISDVYGGKTINPLTAGGAPSVLTASLPELVVGQPYLVSLSASGGTPGYVWSVSAGALPSGLTLSSNGVLSGTVSTPGTYTFTLRVTDGASATAQQEYSFVLAGNPPLTVTVIDSLTKDPINGARVMRHNPDGSFAEEITTAADGVADFGDVGSNRAIITIQDPRNAGMTMLSTFHNVLCGSVTVPLDSDNMAESPTFTLVVNNVPAGSPARQFFPYLELGVPVVSGTTWTYNNASIGHWGWDDLSLQDDGSFDLTAIFNVTAGAEVFGRTNVLLATLQGSTVTINLNQAPGTVGFTSNAGVREVWLGARRNGGDTDIGNAAGFLGGSATTGALLSGAYGTLTGDDFYWYETRSWTPTADLWRSAKLAQSAPANLSINLPSMDLSKPTVSNSGGLLRSVSWALTNGASADFMDIWIEGVMTGNSQDVEWDIMLSPTQSSLVLPQLPGDLGGVAEMTNNTLREVSVEIEANDEDGISGYDDGLSQYMAALSNPDFDMDDDFAFGDVTVGVESEMTIYRLAFMHFSQGGSFGGDYTPTLPGTVVVSSYHATLNVNQDRNYPPASQVLFTGPAGSGLSGSAANGAESWIGDEYSSYNSPQISSPAIAPSGVWQVSYKGVTQPFTKPDPQVAARLAVPLPTAVVSTDVLQSLSWQWRNPDGTLYGGTGNAPAFVEEVMVNIHTTGDWYDAWGIDSAETEHTLTRTVYWSDVTWVDMSYVDSLRNHYIVSFIKSGIALEVTTSELPDAYQGEPYSEQLFAAQGQGPYTWAVIGSLPPGLSVSPSGTISGTPTAPGPYDFTVEVTDNLSDTATRSLSIFVNSGAAGGPTVELFSGDSLLTEPGALATDGTNLYVVNNSTNIYSIPLAGGAASLLYTTGHPSILNLVVVGNDLYWIDPNADTGTACAIFKAPKSGSGPITMIYSDYAKNNIVDGSGLTTDGSFLYTADEVQGRVHKLNLDGSGIVQLGSRYGGYFDLEHYNAIAYHGGTLYVADDGNKSASGIPAAALSISTSGGSFTTLASDSPLMHPTGIAVNAIGDVLFVADAAAGNTIWGMPTSGGTPSEVVSGSPFVNIARVMYNNGALYVSDTGNTGPGAIYKVLLEGGGSQPTQLGFVTQPSNVIVNETISPAVRVAAKDAGGMTVTSYTGTITISIGTNPGTGTLSGTLSAAAVNGVATFDDLSIDEVGSGYILAAAADGLTGTSSVSFQVLGGAPTATQLAFVIQPSNTVTGAAISPSVQVAAKDAGGNTVTTYTGTITLAIGTNPSGGTLSGTVARAAVNGVAVFPGLSIDAVGVGYTLTASADGLTSATSSTFNIMNSGGSATQLNILVQPSNTPADAEITPAVQVEIQDAGGTRVTSATNTVTLAIGTNPGAGTLSGTVARTAVNGVAVFPGLSIDALGVGYTLTASAGGLTSDTSSTFDITSSGGSATQLSFMVQPSASLVDATINPAVQVEIQDVGGTRVTSATNTVTLAIGTNPGGGTLVGNMSVAAVAGVATFNNVSIDAPGNGYTLTATAGGLTADTSNGFNVTPPAPGMSDFRILTHRLEDAATGQSYSSQVRTWSGSAPITFGVDPAGNPMPPGLTLNTNGTVTGTPTEAMERTVMVMAQDNNGAIALGHVKIVVGTPVVPLEITTGSVLPTGQVGTAYAMTTLQAVGGEPPYIWSFAEEDALFPDGLVLTRNGVLMGTPQTSGQFFVQVRVRDSGKPRRTDVTENLMLTIDPNPSTFRITTVALPNAQVGVEYNQSVAVAGGTVSQWIADDEALSLMGLTFANGVVFGTPTASGVANFFVAASDSSTPRVSAAAVVTFVVTPESPLGVLSTALPEGRCGVPYSGTLTAQGVSGSETWSLEPNQEIPDGLTLNSDGTITGTYTNWGEEFAFLVRVTDGPADSVGLVRLVMADDGPILWRDTGAGYDPQIMAGVQGTPYDSMRLSVTNTESDTTRLAVHAGTSMPAGLSLDPIRRQITGTPTIPGRYRLALDVRPQEIWGESINPSYPDHAILDIRPAGAFKIVTRVLPSGQEGDAYSAVMYTQGESGTVTFSVESGNLPPGLSLNATAGTITGTPSVADRYSFVIAADDGLTTARMYYEVPVDPADGFGMAYGNLPNATVGAMYDGAFYVRGVISAVTWSLDAGSPAVPDGLTFDDIDGRLLGTPTTPGNTNLVVVATESPNESIRRVKLVVERTPVALTNPMPFLGFPGLAYSDTLTATGGTGPYTFAMAPGHVLPPGLSLAGSGAITGTPTAVGMLEMDVIVTDSSSPAREGRGTLEILILPNLPPALGMMPWLDNDEATVGQPYGPISIGVIGGTGPYTFSLADGSLPSGIILATDGTLSGTTDVAGDFRFTVRVTDSLSATADAVYELWVQGDWSGYSISNGVLPDAAANQVYTPFRLDAGGPGSTWPNTWAVVAGALPSGMSLGTDGMVTGTPTSVGTYLFTAQATDSSGTPQVAKHQIMIVVVP